MKAIICHGISASGKSTFADNWVNQQPLTRHELNRDKIRIHIMNESGKPFTWKGWNWKHEKQVTELFNTQLHLLATNKYDIIISDTNLNIDRVNLMVTKLQALGYTVEHKYFQITLDEAISRDNARPNGVGLSVIAKQYDEWINLIRSLNEVPQDITITELYNQDIYEYNCIIVDIDGTLAHSHHRSMYDWDKVHLDTVDEAVKSIVNIYHKTGKTVYIMSGRDSACRQLTLDWLNDNDIYFDCLLMRPKGDMRKDTIVKLELFNQYIRGNFKVDFVIDDRPSVCEQWRELGLKVLQVGNPNIRF